MAAWRTTSASLKLSIQSHAMERRRTAAWLLSAERHWHGRGRVQRSSSTLPGETRTTKAFRRMSARYAAPAAVVRLAVAGICAKWRVLFSMRKKTRTTQSAQMRTRKRLLYAQPRPTICHLIMLDRPVSSLRGRFRKLINMMPVSRAEVASARGRRSASCCHIWTRNGSRRAGDLEVQRTPRTHVGLVPKSNQRCACV